MTTDLQTLRVNLGERSYDIQIGTGTLAQAGAFLVKRARVSHAVVLTDQNVERPHALAAAESIAEQLAAVDLAVIEPGEESKSVAMAAALWEKLLELGADRTSVIVAVGGGVVGDLAGFVAATYARGIRFFQVPTSLLAQVDSSVGGKVAINLPGAKNMVGAFLQPRGVLIDIATLQTLPERQYRSGLAEVVKYGVILDAEFFEFLQAHAAGLARRDPDLLVRVVARSCQLKALIVEKDERDETGLRAALNYGHTFAHALEALGQYHALLHGEAVAIGMLCASRLAERLGRVDERFTARQRDLLAALGLPTELPPVDRDQMLQTMTHDKKVEHGQLRFVLPTRMGHVELVGGVNPEDVRGALGD
ncbi:MAG: 3-dehydroquinate synthase [Thermoguttaceae bacterium]